MAFQNHVRVVAFLLLMLSFSATSQVHAQQSGSLGDATRSIAEPTGDEIQRWIEQLGAKTFAERERALQALRQIGPAAFTSLRMQKDADDPEIRLRVRKLLEEFLPQLLRRNVPYAESTLIQDYLTLQTTDRRDRIRLVANRLMPQIGTVALLRIAQLESDTTTAKIAAAGLLAGGMPSPEQREEILGAMSMINRPDLRDDRIATSWVRAFQESLSDPGTATQDFDVFAEDEAATLQREPAATDERSVVWPLRRYGIALRMAAGDEPSAIEMTKRMFGDEDPDGDARSLLVTWLHQRGYSCLIVALGESHQQWFENNRLCLYLYAAALAELGQEDTAKGQFEAAFAAGEDDANDRMVMAATLRQLQIDEWSQREYEAIYTRENFENSTRSFQARRMQADLWSQQERFTEAADLMEQAIQLCEDDETGQSEENLDEVPLGSATLPQFYADMFFFRAMAARQENDQAGQIENFRRAFAYSKENSDAICEAYKVDDESWRRELRRLVTERLLDLRTELKRYEAALQRDARFRAAIASRDNEISWILVNTEGNLDDALRHAQRSVEYNPGQSYSIDTLATCYFQLGQVERATELERMACQLSPHREDIARTLRRFEAGL